ncbi:DUF3151 domain-containing protein [Solicola gregarius]|uniref:DUF3151 domain-containing protein n=1 Tax=Solicola gregarius TaxID=2908642 RepID=A0AA46TDV7_9ACTN|nr:DUF3151 domain-containing protein [Solicola gregarius]UYM03481.1 DUF3151 domain-containing protein [Solicola gregarius]
MTNLLGEPPETRLPDDPASAQIDAGAGARDVARQHPSSSLVWAVLAELALNEGKDVEAYAFARTGYHRGLDALRRNGWKGHGPIPWSHEPNRGFLRALYALALASAEVGDGEEAARCSSFLQESSAEAYDALAAG